ncbi:MAG TPA: ROK family protein [Nitrososphaerales archaeon]|nr:ROK family protein [Nitrososphaerales archaeon]
MEEMLGVGIDLGATRIRACLGTRTGRILRRKARNMVVSAAVGEYLEQISTIVAQVTNDVPPGKIQGVCLASPGPLDVKRGLITHTANLPYRDVPVIAFLKESLGFEAYLVNDANAAALGEKERGAGKGRSNIFYLTISTGIGGGAIVDGRLLLGKEGNAAEVGHITIDSLGRLTCGCGKRGHWEAYCSGTGIPALARLTWEELEKSGRAPSSGGKLRVGMESVNAADVFREAERGDSFALHVVNEVGRLNAIGVANITDAYDPELVTIGGGVALNNPERVLSPIRKMAGDYAINRVPEVRITPLGDNAGLLGALSVSFDPSLISP